MKAVMCKGYGPPESLVIEDLPDPSPGAGEVLVDVTYVGLNFFDTLIIRNKYQIKPELPFSPASEFSGRVAALGAGVSGFRVGDRVCGSLGHGAARSKVVVKPNQIYAIPEGLSDERAAGLIITYGTSHHALKQRAKLRPGETLAVLGASGGVGIAAVELGALMGARVIACASSQDKIDFARRHGAVEGIDYSKSDLKDELRRLTGGKGVDVVYDPVGGDFAEQALRAMAWMGRFLIIGFAAGPIPKLPLNIPLLKSLDVLGVYWGAWTQADPAAHRENMAELLAWARDGKLKASIHAVLPLEQAAEGINMLARREAQGKVLLKV